MAYTSYIKLGIELDTIRNFLDRTIQDVWKELNEIEERNQEGHYEDFGAYESAYSTPLGRLDLILESAVHAINIFFEENIKAIAHDAWMECKNDKRVKNLFELYNNNMTIKVEDINKITTIDDLPFGYVIKLAEEYYKIDFEKIKHHTEISKLREIDNSLKHNSGYKSFRKIKNLKENFLERLEVEEKHIYHILEISRSYIIELWKVTGQEPKTRPIEDWELYENDE